MQKYFIKVVLTFFLIFFLNIIIISKEGKDNDDKKTDTGNNSQKGLNRKNEDRNNIKKGTIQEKRDKNENVMESDLNKDDNDSKRNEIIKIIDDTENIIDNLKLFQRNINQLEGDDFINIQNQYYEITKKIENLNNENILLILNLDNYQKKEVKEQIVVIEESKKKTNDLIFEIKKEFESEKKDKKKLSMNSKELEKEINKINKQFRAIEWIIYEQ